MDSNLTLQVLDKICKESISSSSRALFRLEKFLNQEFWCLLAMKYADVAAMFQLFYLYHVTKFAIPGCMLWPFSKLVGNFMKCPDFTFS
jgi:hypothetical protein